MADEQAGDAAGRRDVRWTVAVVGLAVVLVALLAAGTVLLVERSGTTTRDERRDAAVATARDVMTRLASLRADDLQPQVDALADRSTGPFREQLFGTRSVLGSLAGSARFSSRGSVTSAGLESEDGHLASVLVTATSQVSNAEDPQGRTRTYAQVVTLEYDGTRWLVDGVNAP
jgi:Mce-associated membrane protein